MKSSSQSFGRKRPTLVGYPGFIVQANSLRSLMFCFLCSLCVVSADHRDFRLLVFPLSGFCQRSCRTVNGGQRVHEKRQKKLAASSSAACPVCELSVPRVPRSRHFSCLLADQVGPRLQLRGVAFETLGSGMAGDKKHDILSGSQCLARV